jgi:hypothetical protein
MNEEVTAHLKIEALKPVLEVNANKTRYMRVTVNLSNLRQDLNVDSHVSEEVTMFMYLGALLTEKRKLVHKLR